MERKAKVKVKSQVGIMEIAVILIAFALLIAIIFVFYGRYQNLGIERIKVEVDEARATSLLNKIASMPELRCSLSFDRAAEINCIDELKLLALSQSDLRLKYERFFSGVKAVRIVRAFPPGKEGVECRFSSEYPEDCGYWQLYKSESQSEKSFDTITTLCIQEDLRLKCEIGRLIITV